MKAYEFANAVKGTTNENITAMSVFLSDKHYSNTYGHKVLPLKVHCYASTTEPIVVGFNQLLELFNKVPYINTNKRLHNGFMILRIDLHEQEYNGSKYYKTNIRYIHQDEQIQPKLESLRDKVVDRIKEFKAKLTPIDYLEEFDTL